MAPVVSKRRAARKSREPDVGNDGYNDDEDEDTYGNVGPGDDHHTMAEDMAGNAFNFVNTLRKAMERSACREMWEDLRVNSDGLPILERMDFGHSMTHSLKHTPGALSGGWHYEPIQWDDHDSVTSAEFPPDATVVCFGQRRSGKSHFTKEAMWYLQDWYPRGIVFSDTDKMLRHYSPFINKKYIVPKYDPAIQEAVNQIQKSIKEDHAMYERLKKEQENFMRQFVIYDDCINKKGIFHYKAGDPLRRIFVNGRHYETLLWFNTQYPMAIPPDMRANVDWAFMFNAAGANERDALYELFGQPLSHQHLFAGLLAHNTTDYGMMAVNNQQTVVRIVDRYKWYRAKPDPPPEFQMGDSYFQQGGNDGVANQLSYPRKAPPFSIGTLMV